jgi:superfamily I DNA and/or RNA helicase
MDLIPLDFSDRFKSNLTRFKDYKAIIQRIRENTRKNGTEMDILQFYLDNVWPNRREATALVKKITRGDQIIFEFRPLLTEQNFDYLLVDGRVLAIQSILTRGQSLQIIAMSLVPNSAPQAFEAELNGTFYWSTKKKFDFQDLDFLKNLSPVKEHVADPIEQWSEFLNWQEQQIIKNQKSFYYEDWKLNKRSELVLNVKLHKKLPHYIRKSQINKEFALAPQILSKSKSRWIPDDENVRLYPIGFIIRFIEEKNSRKENHEDRNSRTPKNQRLGKSKKSFNQIKYRVIIDLDEDFLQKLKETDYKFPSKGFIVSSIAGDIAPLRNQKRALERFSAGKFYCPNLSKFIFKGKNVQVSAKSPIPLKKTLHPLNPRQKKAVQKALITPELFLLQGPPGTGKTTVIAELCYQITALGGNVLVSSQTNLAVDNALNRLVNVPHLRPLRIGASHRVTEQGIEFLPENATRRWMKAIIEECNKQLNNIKKSHKSKWKKIQLQWIERLKNPSNFDIEMFTEIYQKQANVFGMTCNEAGKVQFWSSAFFKPFDLVVIDEVSKATLPELLMPMLLGKRIALVGDHRQLPPMFKEVTFQEAVEEGELDNRDNGFKKFEKLVTTSLYVELFDQVPNSLKETLTIQYRMHPEIMHAVNNFYMDSPLTCGIKNPDDARAHGIAFGNCDKNRHLLWIDSSYRGGTIPAFEIQAGTSKLNELEIDLVTKTLVMLNQELIKAGYTKHKRKKIGVISFYGAQLLEMRLKIREFQSKGYFKSMEIRTNTVDRFQGMERPIIILSMVRAKRGQVGDFVKRFQRINVAMSRAQELLIIIGSAKTFARFEVEVKGKTGKTIMVPVYRNILSTTDKLNGYIPAEVIGL